MDGGEVACQIQTDQSLKDTPIVFLTSLVLEQEAGDQGALIGGFPFVAKPVNIKRLTERMERIFKQTETARPSTVA
jgi:CheY-like chemotaxis protein